MSNFKSSMSRALTTATSVATILWSVGVFTAAPVQAATLNNGDLVKSAGTTAVYLIQGTTKRVFPHLNVYLSWGYPSDFGTVKTVSAADLSQYTEGDAVPFRDGYMFRGTATGLGGLSATAVYVVENGLRRPVQSSEVYQALYNDASWARVTWVPDDLLTKFNYALGSVVTTTTSHPDGTLVKYAGTDQVYLLSGGKKRALGTGALASNRYNAALVVTVPASEVYADNTSVAGYEMALTMPLAAAGSTTTATTVSGQVTVSLSANQPLAASIPMGSFYAPLLNLDVHNGTNVEVKLTGFVVGRYGIMADRDINGVLVIDADGNTHGNLTTFGQAVSSPGFATNPIKIAAGATAVVKVTANLVASASASSTSNTLGAQLIAPSSVIVTDSNGNPVSVGGTFPVKGPLMSTVSGSGSLGSVTVTAQQVNGGTGITSATATLIDQGTKDYDSAKFRFQETTGNENVEIMNLSLQNIGSASANDFFNIRLVDQDGNVVGQADAVVANQVKFAVKGVGASKGANGGYLLKQGQLRDFTVRLDTSATSNSGGRTLNWTLQSDYDVRAVGISTGVGVTISASTPVGTGTNGIMFRSGTISISRSTDSLSGKIAAGATDLEVATFDVRAFGEDIELQDVGFVILDASGGLDVGRYVPSGTVKIKNDAGQTIYSLTSTTEILYGSNGADFNITSNVIAAANANGTGPSSSSSTTKLNSTYVIRAGTTGKLRFVMDVNQSAVSTDAYTYRITYLQYRNLSANTIGSSASAGGLVTGNSLAVESSTLTVTANTSFNPQTLVKGGTLQKIGSYNLQAGAAESQTVTALAVQLCIDDEAVGVGAGEAFTTTNCVPGSAGTDLVTAANYLIYVANTSNIEIREGTTRLSPAQTITTEAGVTYSLQGFTIPANQTRVIDIYGVVSTGFDPGTDRLGTLLNISSSVGGQSQTSTDPAAKVGQGITFSDNGTLTVVDLGTDGSINTKKVLHGSESDVPLYKFQLAEGTNAEAITLQKVYLAALSGTNTFTDYKLFDADTNTQIGVTAPANIVAGTTGEIRFTGLNYQIPKGSAKTLLVKASTVDGGTMIQGSNVKMVVTFMETVGQSSGSTVRDSGGVVVSSVAGTTYTITVSDGSQFETGDTVRIDADANGDFSDTDVLVVGPTTYYICGLSTATFQIDDSANCGSVIQITGTLTAGAVITPVAAAFYSQNAHVEEVEPVITALQVGAGNQVLENTLGVYTVTAQGVRDLSVAKLRFEVSGSYNSTSTSSARGYSPVDFKLDRANPTTGERSSDSSLNTLADEVVYSYLGSDGVAVAAGGRDVNNGGALSIGGTSIIFHGGTTSNMPVGSRVIFGADTNGGIGYRVVGYTSGDMNDDSGTMVISPGLQTAVADSTEITMAGTIDGAAIAIATVACTPTATSIFESGAVIQFTLSGEKVNAGTSKAYMLIADTTRIKDNTSSGSTASTTVRMLGTAADQVNDVPGPATLTGTNGIVWSYTKTTGSSSGNHSISDSYIVTGKTVLYL